MKWWHRLPLRLSTEDFTWRGKTRVRRINNYEPSQSVSKSQWLFHPLLPKANCGLVWEVGQKKKTKKEDKTTTTTEWTEAVSSRSNYLADALSDPVTFDSLLVVGIVNTTVNSHHIPAESGPEWSTVMRRRARLGPQAFEMEVKLDKILIRRAERERGDNSGRDKLEHILVSDFTSVFFFSFFFWFLILELNVRACLTGAFAVRHL